MPEWRFLNEDESPGLYPTAVRSLAESQWRVSMHTTC